MASTNGELGGSALQGAPKEILFNDPEYDKEFRALQEYIPFVNSLMKKTGVPQSILRLQSLNDLLSNDKSRMNKETLLKCKNVLKKIHTRIEESKTLHSTDSDNTQEKKNEVPPVPDSNSPPEEKSDDRSMMKMLKLAAARTARNSGVGAESPSSSLVSVSTDAKQESASSSLERSRDKLKMLLPFSIPDQEEDAARSPRNFESIRLHPDSPRNDWDFQDTGTTPKSPICWNPYPPEIDGNNSSNKWKVIDEYNLEEDGKKMLSTANNQNTKLVLNASPVGSSQSNKSLAKQTSETLHVIPNHPLTVKHVLDASSVSKTVHTAAVSVMTSAPTPVSKPVSTSKLVPSLVSEALPSPVCQPVPPPVCQQVPPPTPQPVPPPTPQPVPPPAPQPVPPPMELNLLAQDHDSEESTARTAEAKSAQQSLRAKLSQEINKVHRVGTSTGGSLRGLASKDPKIKIPILSKEAGSILDKDKIKVMKKPEKIIEIDMFSKEHTSSGKKVQEKNASPKLLKGLYAPRFVSLSAQALLTSPKPVANKNKTSTERILKSPVYAPSEAEMKNPSRCADSVAAVQFGVDAEAKNEKSGTCILANMTQEEIKRAVDLNLRDLPSPPTISAEILDSGKTMSTLPSQSTAVTRPAFSMSDVNEYNQKLSTQSQIKKGTATLHELPFLNAAVSYKTAPTIPITSQGAQNKVEVNISPYSTIPRAIVDNCFPSNLDTDLRAVPQKHSILRCDPRVERAPLLQSPFPVFDHNTPSSPYDDSWKVSNEDSTPRTPRHITYNLDQSYQHHGQQHQEDPRRPWGNNTPRTAEQFDLHRDCSTFPATTNHEMYGPRDITTASREETRQNSGLWHEDTHWQNFTDHNNPDIVQEPLSRNRYHDATNHPWMSQHHARTSSLDPNAVPRLHQPFVSPPHQRQTGTSVDHMRGPQHHQPYIPPGNKRQVGPSCNQPVNNLHTGNQQPLDWHGSINRGNFDRPKTNFEQPANRYSWSRTEFGREAPPTRPELIPDAPSVNSRNIGPELKPISRVEAVPRCPPENSYRSRNERLSTETQHRNDSNGRRRSVEQKDKSSRNTYQSAYKEKQRAFESRRKSFEKERASRQESDKKDLAETKQIKKDEIISPLNSLYGSTIIPRTGQGYGFQKFKIPKIKRDPPVVGQPVTHDLPAAEKPRPSTPSLVKPTLPIQTILSTSPPVAEVADIVSLLSPIVVAKENSSDVSNTEVNNTEACSELPQASTSKDATTEDESVEALISKALGMNKAKMIFDLLCTKLGKLDGKKLKEFLFEPSSDEHDSEDEKVKKATVSDRKSDVKVSLEPLSDSNVIDLDKKSVDPEEKITTEEKRKTLDDEQELENVKEITVDEDSLQLSRRLRDRNKNKTVTDIPNISIETSDTKGRKKNKKMQSKLANVEDEETKEPDQSKPAKLPKAKRRNYLEMLQADILNMFISEGVLHATGRRLSTPFKEDINRAYNQLSKKEQKQQDASTDEGDSSTLMGVRTKSRNKRRKADKKRDVPSDKRKGILQKKQIKKGAAENTCSSESDLSDVPVNDNFDSDDSDVEVKINKECNKMASDKENKEVVTTKQKSNARRSRKSQALVTDPDKSFDELLLGRKGNVDMNKSLDSKDRVNLKPKRVPNFDSAEDSDESSSLQTIPIRSTPRVPHAVVYSSECSDDGDRRSKRRNSPACYLEDFSESGEDEGKKSTSKKTVKSIGNVKGLNVYNKKKEERVQKKKKTAKKTMRPKSRVKIYSSDSEGDCNSNSDEDSPKGAITKPHSVHQSKHLPLTEYCTKPPFLVPLLTKLPGEKVGSKEFDPSSSSDSTFEQIPLSKIPGPFSRSVARRGGKSFNRSRVSTISPDIQEQSQADLDSIGPDQTVKILFRAGRKTNNSKGSLRKSIQDVIERLTKDVNSSQTSDILKDDDIPAAAVILKRKTENSRKLFFNKLETSVNTSDKESHLQNDKTVSVSSRKNINKKRKRNNWSQGVIKKNKRLKSITERGRTRTPDPIDDDAQLVSPQKSADDPKTSETGDHDGSLTWTEGEEQLKSTCSELLNPEVEVKNTPNITDAAPHIEEQLPLTEAGALDSLEMMQLVDLVSDGVLPVAPSSDLQLKTVTCDESLEGRSATEESNGSAAAVEEHVQHKLKADAELLHLEEPISDQSMGTNDDKTLKVDTSAVEKFELLAHGIKNVDKEYVFCEDPSKRYQCKLCTFNGVAIVAHYLLQHPSEEPYISRLPVTKAETAIAESKQNLYSSQTVSAKACGKRIKKSDPDFICRICYFKTKNAATFYEHCCSHTGEFCYSCDECQQKMANLACFRSHVHYYHRQLRAVKSVTYTVLFEKPSFNTGTVFAYLCSSCNFVQMLKSNVEKHIKFHHSGETSPEIVLINMHAQTSKTRKKLRRPRKSADNSAPEGTTVQDPSTELTSVAELPSTGMSQESSSGMPQQDVNLTVFVPTDVRDEEKEKSILEQRKNMLEEITKNLTNRGFLNNEKRSSLFDVLSKRTEDVGELSSTDDTNFPQSYDEENLSIGADEASFLVAQLEQNSLMDEPLGNANNDDNTSFSIEVNHEDAIQSNEELVCQNTVGASSTTDGDPGMPTFSAKKASYVMDNLIERLKQSTSTVPSPCEQLPVIKQEKPDGDPNSTIVKVEPDDVGTISVGPFEAKPMKTFQLFSCLVSDCVYTSMSPKRFVLHVVTHHPHDTWNGLCQTCNLMCNASTAIPSQGGQFSLVLAVLHLLKSHLLLETETEDDHHQDVADPGDAETLEGGQSADGNSGGPVFRIRMRRLSGDKLSLAKDFQEDEGVPNDGAVSRHNEAVDEQDMMPCVIENVVSLAEEANKDLTDAPLFPFTLSLSEPDPNTVVPLHFPPPTRVQTAYFGMEKPAGNAFSSQSTITVVASPVPQAAPANTTIGVHANPIFQTHAVLQKISLAAVKKHKPVLPKQKPDPLVALPLESATVLSLDATTHAISKTKQTKKQAVKNVSKVILKSGSRTVRPQRLFKKNGTFITENESKDEACYAAMMNPRKLRHLFKCVEEKCFFTSNCWEKFWSHLGSHKKQIRQQRFGCTYCYKDKLTTREELITHIQTKHGHCLYQCAYCFYRAVVPSYVVQHQNTLHINESISILLCVQPPDIPAAPELALHPSEIVAPYRCHQGNCNAVYHLTSEFASHLISEHSQLHIYSCHVCEAQVFNPGRLISHYKNYHSFAFYQCTYCVHGADTEESMHRHLSKLHPHLLPKVAVRENDVEVATCARTDVTTPLRIVDLETNNKIDRVFIVKPTPADLEEDDAVDETLATEPACEDEEDGDCEGGLVIDEGPDVEGETLVPTGVESLVCESVISVQPPVESSDGTVDIIDLVDLSEDEASASQVGDSNLSSRPELSHPSSSSLQAAGLQRLTRSYPQKSTQGSVGDQTVADQDPAPTPTQRVRPAIAPPTPAPGNAAGASFEFGAITTEELALTGKTGAALNRCGYAKCGYSCADQSELRDHLMVCDNSRDSHALLCPHCERSVRNVSGLIEHLKLHGTARYGCGLCQFRGTTARFVSGHLKSRHRVQHTKCIPLNPYKMDIEKDLFVVGPLREKVSRWGRKTPNSPTNTKPKFVYQPNEGHLLPMGAIYPFKVTCATCSFTTKVRINMERHLAFHDSGVTVPSQTPVNAVPCLEKHEMMFDKMTNLAASSNMYKPPDAASLVLTAADIARLPKYVPEQERYVCGATHCNYSSCDENMLLHHLRALHRDEDYVCPHCTQSAALLPAAEHEQAIPMERLSFHLKMHDNRLYKCGYCFYFDHRRYIVDRHLTDKHRDRKPIVHAVREPSGSNSLLAASDEAEVVEKEPTPTKEVPTKVSWQCGLCEFESSTRSEMVLHTSNAHNIKSQFKCNLCAYRSSTAQGFDVHFSAKHSGEEPDFIRTYFRVDVASPETSAFDTSPLWSRDLPRVKHIRGILFDDGKDKPRVEKATPKATQAAASSTEVAEVVVEEPSSAYTFDCSLCTTFKTNNMVDMRLHLFKEMKYLRYICNHCHKKTCYRKHLVKHLHRVHPEKLAHQSFTVLAIDKQVEAWVEDYLTTQQSLMKKLDSTSRELKLRLAAQSASPSSDDEIAAEEDLDITTTPSDYVSEDDISPRVVKSQKKQKLPRILPCNHCGERFSTVRGLKLHIRFAHLRIGKWKCAACEMTHNAKVFVERHCQALHPLVTGDLCLANPHADEPLVLDTAFWEREYGIGPNFAEQYSTSSSAATAPKRAKLSATPDETADEVNKCRHCPYRAKSSSDLRRHHMRHWKQKPLKCGRCDFDGIREFEIKKHSLKIHPNKEVLVVQNKLPDVPVIQPIRTKRKPDTDYVCEVEDDGLEVKKSRTEPEEMIEFVIVEGLGEGEGLGDEVPDSDPAQLAQCFYCDFSGSTSKDVYEHWTSAHKEPVLLLNGSCKAGTGLVFKELASLQDEEMFTRAVGESRFSCGYCVYHGTLASVTEHQKCTHSRLPSLLKTLPADIYSCRLCNFKTSEVSSIRLHATGQHGCRQQSAVLEADGYRCVYCTQQTATFEAMLQHHNSCHPSMEFHVGSKQTAGSGEDLVDVYNCPDCSYFTPDLRYMKEHLRRHARPYQCGYCLLTADFPGKVRQHSASAHPGRPPNIMHLATNEDKYNQMKDLVTVSREKRGTFSGGGGVAKKSTTWRSRTGARSKPVARKSTGNSPKSQKYLLVSPCIDLTGADDDEVEDLQPFSVYGEPRERVDLGKLTMQVTLGSALTVLRVTTYAGCFNINPVVLLQDCRK